MTHEPRDLSWQARAACVGADPNLFFLAEGEQMRTGRFDEARAICQRCPVEFRCDVHATATKEKWGVWAEKDRGEAKHAQRVAREEQRKAEERSRVLGVDVSLSGRQGEAEVRVALADEAASGRPDALGA